MAFRDGIHARFLTVTLFDSTRSSAVSMCT